MQRKRLEEASWQNYLKKLKKLHCCSGKRGKALSKGVEWDQEETKNNNCRHRHVFLPIKTMQAFMSHYDNQQVKVKYSHGYFLQHRENSRGWFHQSTWISRGSIYVKASIPWTSIISGRINLSSANCCCIGLMLFGVSTNFPRTR